MRNEDSQKNYVLNNTEVSEKIEQLILNFFGKTYIYWESLFFLLNKLIFFSLIIIFLYRAEFLTSIINITVFSIEKKIVSKINYEKIFFGLLISWLNDCIWFTFYLIVKQL